jgi:hypothetical protein
MKHLLTLILLCALTALNAQVYVRGYYRSDGTYVQPHYRSYPNHTVYDNYSTKGNINPYTGKKGTKNPPSYRSHTSSPPLSAFYSAPRKKSHEWTKIAVGDGTSTYLDFGSIQTEGSLVYFWVKNVYESEQARLATIDDEIERIYDKYTSERKRRTEIAKWRKFSFYLAYDVYDMRRKTMQTLKIVNYDYNGDVLSSFDWQPYEAETRHLVPGSLGMIVYDELADYLETE